jgi:hypothetical protein
MFVLADSETFTMDDLPPMTCREDRDAAAIDFPQGLTLEKVERAMVYQTLDRCRGNRTRAAESLGISVRTLQRRLKRWENGQQGRTRCGVVAGGGVGMMIAETPSPSRIDPNVGFFSGSVYTLLGIPRHLFTPLFAAARSAGWLAHILEQREDNRLYRPKARFVGPQPRRYLPVDERPT